MKLKKSISRFLILGILLNNIYSYSNANDLNRYETLEGESITIDNSIEGSLEEIEIFGNTVQNPDNLEDIQSVGDLYMDEDDNPILDNYGKEQYKIELKTTGINLFNGNLEKVSIDGGDGSVRPWDIRLTYMSLIPCKKGDIISAKIFSDEFIFREFYYYSNNEIDSNYYLGKVTKNSNVISYVKECVFTATENGYFTFQIAKNDTTSSFTDEDVEKAKKSIQISHANEILSNYSPYTEVTKIILLPTQLQKVGNVADRLYWDNGKHRYIIEKNIKEVTLNGTETNWSKSDDWVNLEGQNTVSFQRPMAGIIYNAQRDLRIISNRFKALEVSSASIIIEDTEWIRPYSSTSENVGIRILKSKLSGENVEDFKQWLKINPVKVYYQLRSPEIINTEIKDKLNIVMHNNQTSIYIDSSNGVNPYLRITIDRLPQMANEEIINAEESGLLKDISLARLYVNMLPESLYKDQLQEKLNTIFTSEITIDRKTVSNNMDLYIKLENTLSMSLSTNSVTFENYSGIEDIELLNAVNITVHSSLPYDLNVYMPSEIYNSDKSKFMNIATLNIRESTKSVYQKFANTIDKIVLDDNCESGNDKYHSIDLKLSNSEAHKADVYKTVLKFEVEQK